MGVVENGLAIFDLGRKESEWVECKHAHVELCDVCGFYGDRIFRCLDCFTHLATMMRMARRSSEKGE